MIHGGVDLGGKLMEHWTSRLLGGLKHSEGGRQTVAERRSVLLRLLNQEDDIKDWIAFTQCGWVSVEVVTHTHRHACDQAHTGLQSWTSRSAQRTKLSLFLYSLLSTLEHCSNLYHTRCNVCVQSSAILWRKQTNLKGEVIYCNPTCAKKN